MKILFLFFLFFPAMVYADVAIPDTFERMSAIANKRVDTPFNFGDDIRIKFSYRILPQNLNAIARMSGSVGTRTDGSSNFYIMPVRDVLETDGSRRVLFTGGIGAGIIPPTTTPSSVEYDIPNGKFYHNGIQRNLTLATNYFKGQIIIGGFIDGNGVINSGFGSTNLIYNTKIWRSGVLVADYVPVRRRSDNVCGMFNAVDGTFYSGGTCHTFETEPWKI